MKYILVLGFGWSGSSAVVDLLNEYENIYVPSVEFRLIKDSGGLADLRYNIVENWTQIGNVDISIKHFLWLVDKMNRQSKKIPTTIGLDYGNKLNPNFKEFSLDFINNISKKISAHWFYLDYNKKPCVLFREKINDKLKIKNKSKTMYYSLTDANNFDFEVKKYINRLFSFNNGNNTIVLDQALSVCNPEIAKFFFDDYKIIIVDRDPRDIYCDVIKSNGTLSEEFKKNNVEFFVSFFNKQREKISNIVDERIKIINFEDLCINYDETLADLEKFLELDSSKHIKKKQVFNPEKSKNNIGKYKNENCDDYKIIANLLGGYLKNE